MEARGVLSSQALQAFKMSTKKMWDAINGAFTKQRNITIFLPIFDEKTKRWVC